MPNQFFSPEGDLENYFVTESWLIDQYVGDELWIWGNSTSGLLGNNTSSINRSTPITTLAGGTNWKQASAGLFHSLAIKTDGTLWVWGENNQRQLGDDTITPRSTPITTIAGGTNWKQVSAGYRVSAAIKTDGTLWTWGNSSGGRLGRLSALTYRSTPVTTFAGGTNWANTATANPEDLYTLSMGGTGSVFNNSTAAIKTDGTLWVWGNAFSGAMGNGVTTGSITTPSTTFSGGTNWRSVSCSFNFTAATKTDGTLWLWGGGGSGRLGNASTVNVSTPITTFAGGTNWKQVSCGNQHVAATKTDGTLWLWGSTTYGRLGNAITTVIRSTPVTTFAGGINWKHVSCGNRHTAATKTDGTLWLWGAGANGMLGNATTINASTPITTFAGGIDWKQVSCCLHGSSAQHTAAVKTDGTLWAWGNNIYGQLGNSTQTGTVSTPITTFAGGTNWKQVSVGDRSTAAIKTDGTLWTWGTNTYGGLGNGKVNTTSTPVTTFAGGTNWNQVASGSQSFIALKGSEIFTVGANIAASLGIISPDAQPIEGTDWKQLSCGSNHTAAIKNDGTLWTWGDNGYSQLGNISTNPSTTPITTFAGGTNWKQVSCGHRHTVAVKTDGTIWTWGGTAVGALGRLSALNYRQTPVTTFAGGSNWSDLTTVFLDDPADLYFISSEQNNAGAIKSDGTLWVWGNQYNGKLGNANITGPVFTPVTTFAGGNNWKQLSLGSSYSAAIKTDGTLWVWGTTSNGVLGNGVVSGIGVISTPITTFAGGTNWKQISCGSFHNAAIKTDGTLWTWGLGNNGRLGNGVISGNISTPVTTFAGGTNWKHVACGGNTTAATKTDGTLWTWGYGSGGTLGLNDFIQRSTPCPIFGGGSAWKQVSCSSATSGHMIAVRTDGTLWTWGNGSSGQLGNSGSTNTVTTSGNISPGSTTLSVTSSTGLLGGTITNVSPFTSGLIGLTVTNIINSTSVTLNSSYSGGSPYSGTFTFSVSEIKCTPVTTFAGGTNWTQAFANSAGSFAIKTDGTLWVWGSLGTGQSGTNQVSITCSTPVTTFAGGINWKQVYSRSNVTIALDSSQRLFVFGSNVSTGGELGININPLQPYFIENFGGFKQASAGHDFSAAIRTDGTLWTWGNANSGRLGNATTTPNASTPITTFAGGTDWKQVSCGRDTTVAIKTNGTLWTWGAGGASVLGNNTAATIVSTPVTIFAGGTAWKQVSAESHAIAIKSGINEQLP